MLIPSAYPISIEYRETDVSSSELRLRGHQWREHALKGEGTFGLLPILGPASPFAAILIPLRVRRLNLQCNARTSWPP